MQQPNPQPPFNSCFLKHLIGFTYIIYGHNLGLLKQEKSPDLAYLVNKIIQTGKIFGINQSQRVTGEFCLQSLHQNPTTYQGLSYKNAWTQCCEWEVDGIVSETLTQLLEIMEADEEEENDEFFSPSKLKPKSKSKLDIPAFIEGLPTPPAHRERNDELGILNRDYGDSPVEYLNQRQLQGMNLDAARLNDPVAPPVISTSNTFSNPRRGIETLNSGFDTLPVANPHLQRR